MAECAWTRDDKGGEWSTYGEPEGEFQQYGIGIHVLHPGQVNGLYHSESVQEDFLVLGECLLLIEEEERHLKAWDLIHFAPGTRHICIGAGDGPCAILMVGARGPGKTLNYPVTELALKHGVAAPRGDRRSEAGLPRSAAQLPAGQGDVARVALAVALVLVVTACSSSKHSGTTTRRPPARSSPRSS